LKPSKSTKTRQLYDCAMLFTSLSLPISHQGVRALHREILLKRKVITTIYLASRAINLTSLGQKGAYCLPHIARFGIASRAIFP